MNDDEQAHALYRQMQIEVVYRLQVALAVLATLMAKDRSFRLSGLHFDVLTELTSDIERAAPTARRH